MRLSLKNKKWQLFGCLLALFAVYLLWDFEIQRNFGTVQEGKLYRSGQPREAQLQRWIRKYNLRTIIVLKPTLRPQEKEIAERYGVKLYHIPMSSYHGPSEEQWQKILNLLTNEKNFPLLYHCQRGADKTGIITAMYRVEAQHWPLWKALLEMNLHYHIPFFRPALQNYLQSRYNKSLTASFLEGNMLASPS